MIYLIGGAPRVGKSILCQQLAAKLNIGWISTDLLMEVLKVKNSDGTKHKWDASPASVAATAEWFFPCLERFVWGVSSMAEHYAIEGVNFLPAQVEQLSTRFAIRAVFLGRSQMTLEVFDEFLGHSPGYKMVPEELRRQIVEDVPAWSAFIQQEAEHQGYEYVDTAGDFLQQLAKAESVLIAR